MNPNTQIELYDKLTDPLDAIDRIGEIFTKSGMFGCEKTEQGKFLAMACFIERKSPVQMAREYHIIEGKLTDRADAMLAKLKAKGGKYRVITRTTDKAEVEITHDGQTLTFALTWDEVQKEPFVWMGGGKELKKNWRTPRARMQTLWARVVSDGVRTLAPEIVSGIYTPEEIQDDELRPGPTLDLAPPNAPTAPKPASVPAVKSQPVAPRPAEQAPIDVQSTVVPEPGAAATPTSQAPAPAPVPVPPTAPAPVQPAPQQPAKAPTAPAQLTADIVAQLETAIGEHAVKATGWMLTNGWLAKGQSLADLTPTRANRILKQRDSFIRAVIAQTTPQTTPQA